MPDRSGQELIEEFNIIEDNWHSADHKPIELKVILRMDIDSTMLYRRAVNYDITCTTKRIPRFNRLYEGEKLSTLSKRND